MQSRKLAGGWREAGGRLASGGRRAFMRHYMCLAARYAVNIPSERPSGVFFWFCFVFLALVGSG